MECLAVRDDLPEFALGTLPPDRHGKVERHLAWCAGCRKEAGRLSEGAAAVALALEGPRPGPGMEDRVVAAAGPRAQRRRRGRGPVVAAVVAALVAVAGMAWATSMLGRIDRLEQRAGLGVSRIEQVIGELGADARSADLRPVRGAGEGRALVYDGSSDWVLVVVTGLPQDDAPYRAHLTVGGGRMEIGRLWPQGSGQLAVVRIFPAEVSAFDGILVTNGDREPVLRGSLGSPGD